MKRALWFSILGAWKRDGIGLDVLLENEVTDLAVAYREGVRNALLGIIFARFRSSLYWIGCAD
jgi:hypothetical protein